MSSSRQSRNQATRIATITTTSTTMGACILVLFLCTCCTSALGHLGSLADGPYSNIRCCGYAHQRLPHPRLGEAKSPILPYSRVARDPSQNTQYFDSGDENSRYANFKPPSFQHKFPGRLSRFHQSNGRVGGGVGGPALFTKSQIFANGQQQPVTLEKLLHTINHANANSGEEQPGVMGNDEQPTFTPYIGARALSNMREFFEHLQENIEALRKDEDEDYVGDGAAAPATGSSESNSEQSFGFGGARTLPSTSNFRSEWKPHALGDHGLKKIRSFLPFINQESTRTRLGTNLGLGRRRR